jgi:hypothetical protein
MAIAERIISANKFKTGNLVWNWLFLTREGCLVEADDNSLGI